MQKNRFRDLVRNKLSGGFLNEKSQVDSRIIDAYMPAAVNEVMMEGYGNEVRMENNVRHRGQSSSRRHSSQSGKPPTWPRRPRRRSFPHLKSTDPEGDGGVAATIAAGRRGHDWTPFETGPEWC